MDDIPMGLGIKEYEAEFWRKKYWEKCYELGWVNHRNDALTKDSREVVIENNRLGARIRELELMIGFIHRVGDGLHIDHTMLQRTYRLFPDTKPFFKPLKSRYTDE